MSIICVCGSTEYMKRQTEEEDRREKKGELLCPSSETRLPLLAAHSKQNSSTNCLCFQCDSFRVLQTVPLVLSPLSLSFLWWITFPSLFCLKPVYCQHVAHVLDKSKGSFSIGVMRHPCTPFSSLFPYSSPSWILSFTLALLILSCRGKGGPEESNNCDSGAFLALFLKLCRHTQGCLLALMKG